MKIVHITPFYYPIVGGVEEVVKGIAEYMASKGIETYVLTYNRLRIGGLGSLPTKEEINSVHVVRLKPNFIWSYGTYSSELPEILKKLKPDIVHVHVWRHPHVIQVATLKKRLRFKAVLHTHAPFHRINQLGVATWLYHRIGDLLLKQLFNFYDMIIALTPHEREILIKALKVAESKIQVIPNGLKDELFPPAEIASRDSEENTVLYVGRISRSKNVDLLIKAVSHIQKNISIKLILVGPDEGLVNKLYRFSMQYGINLKYSGEVSLDTLKNLYASSTIFAHPAVYEPFGITLLEAQAFGRPCVVTGWGGQLYTAPPNITSLYAKPNSKDFGSKILMLLKDRNLRRKLGTNARNWASRFLWSKILKQYEVLYSQLCE